MARTTADLVKGIIEVDDEEIPDLSPFILTANELVTERCAVVTTYSPERLELIERWLSAHFYAIRDPRRTSESAGQVSESVQMSLGQALKQTTYGQQALLLDTAGGLAALSKMAETGKTQKVGFLWLGTKRRC